MPYVSMKQMLETGVHFGHQTRRWNPRDIIRAVTNQGETVQKLIGAHRILIMHRLTVHDKYTVGPDQL